jgi:hypothetical protein
MGTISDKLMRIINTKEDIRQALISKGYDVPTSIPFKEYAKMISDLPCKVDDFPKLPGDVTRWHFGGLTNEMMAAMDDPRIEDVDHKGRFLSFKNFAWGGMSGVGGYTENYNSNKWYKTESKIDATWTYKSFNARSIKDNRLAQLFYQSSLSDTGFRVLSCTIKVSGLTDGQGIEYVSNGTQQFVIMRIENDGIYHLPSFDFGAKNAYYGFKFLKLQESCNITIEQLPLYPGFIFGDGVDDFAVTEKELNFEDTYTVYTAFIPFQDDPARNMILCGKNDTKDFSINYSGTHLNFKPSTGVNLAVRIDQFALLVCKRNKDITTIINLSTGESRSLKSVEFISNPGLYYLWRNVFATFHAKAAIAGQIIDNGHFTTDEEDENILNWHKKQYPWLFPDQAWTVTGKTNEDEDRATIANITGNGNDLVLSNFGFAEGSGYGLYKQNFSKIQWTSPSARVEATKTNSSFNITEVKSIAIQLYYLSNINEVAFTVPSIKVRVVGLTDGQSVNYRYFVDGVVNYFLISSDGIYDLPAFEFPAKGDYYGFEFTKIQSSCNITIEQIPEYEGYLVTDGVDDEVRSAAFTLNEDWTIVGDWELLSNVQINCGIVKAQNVYLYNIANGLLISINNPRSLQSFGTKSLHAICSDGRLYDRNWVEYEYTVDQNFAIVESSLNIGFNLNNYTQIAFKNLGIYNNQILYKDDCIKAYNYLQTLKAK